MSLPYRALHATHGGIWIASADGEILEVERGQAIAAAADTPMLLLNAPMTGQRLGYPELSGLDLLELFAFVHPARFSVPTPAGLARTLGLAIPETEEDSALLIVEAAQHLLETLQWDEWSEREGAWSSAQNLSRLRWPWAPALMDRITKPSTAERWLFSRLPEWEDQPPRPAPRTVTVAEDRALDQLATLVGDNAERRDGQIAYTRAATHAFDPRPAPDRPQYLLAEAGTGIGKTFGYLAPASLWAKEADGAVWISTYTKALQRQLDRESGRLYPDLDERGAKIVIRKGRENYLCLLNLEDALQGGFAGRAAILAQLVARWAAFSRDGDMVGGDLPGWLPALFRRAGATALTDRRGECVFAACPHYRKCFIERSVRAAEQAELVIANHALVLTLAEMQHEDATSMGRIIFDEGHHLYDAADSTFSAALSGQEAIELRRWVMGPEGRHRGRRRGLAARLMDVASYDKEGAAAIEAVSAAATALPGESWLGRIAEGIPLGPIETLLAAVRSTVFARANAQDAGYGLETEAAELDAPLVEAAGPALETLEAIIRPMTVLRQRLEFVLEDPPDWLDSQARARIEGAVMGITLRSRMIATWIALLARLGGPLDPDFVDWLAVDRFEGRETDIGLHRHWLDPTKPLAETVIKPSHGVIVTSATLRGGNDWESADARAGAQHLNFAPAHFEAASPFDYPGKSDVLIVTDVKKGDIAGLAGAYARLIEAADGGALGLFTAIARLKAVHARIADRLAQSGVPLYSQHVDPIDTGTLVDMFRDDPHASLLGTDAVRDGVDVPGASLRLVLLETVPWPRPTVLHAARKIANGGNDYVDRVVRARLAQAFGRLIRRKDDRGVFVLLSAATPSRLLTAFPEGTPVARVSLDEAVAHVAARLSSAAEIGQQDELSEPSEIR
jgi:ATP-dependent DNA helicase DinG